MPLSARVMEEAQGAVASTLWDGWKSQLELFKKKSEMGRVLLQILLGSAQSLSWLTM